MPAADPMTRTNILDGAVAVLQREGLADLSIRKVATAAGVPVVFSSWGPFMSPSMRR